jgi:hypothetical protein
MQRHLLLPLDLKVRLASLQRARDKMKEMDTSLETCNAQASTPRPLPAIQKHNTLPILVGRGQKP